MPGLLLTERLRIHALQAADHVALDDGIGPPSTYAELWDTAIRVGAGLEAAGVRPGDRVAFALTPSAPYVALVLAAMAAGAVAVPLNTRLTTAEAGDYLEPLRPSLLVSDGAHADWSSALGVPIVLADRTAHQSLLPERLRGLIAAEPTTWTPAEDDPAVIYPTGGTTGTPKGAWYTHRATWLFADATAANQQRTPADVELYFSPFFHISLCTGLLTSLFAGSTVRIMEQFDAGDALSAIGSGCTRLMGSPTMFVAMRSHPSFGVTDRSSVRHVSFGSTNATAEFVNALMSDFPSARLKYGYGATEFGPVTAMHHDDMVAGRLSGVGRPHPGVRFRVIGPDGRELPVGEIGEIAVSCVWQANGYWERPEETARTWTESGVALGDLGSIDETGWVTVAGRSKEMIITGGENVFPSEVENVLEGHPSVSEVCVFGVPDDYWGERVEGVVVAAAGHAVDVDALRAFARSKLAGYKVPKHLHQIDALPLTANNKPNRRALRAAAEATPETTP